MHGHREPRLAPSQTFLRVHQGPRFSRSTAYIRQKIKRAENQKAENQNFKRQKKNKAEKSKGLSLLKHSRPTRLYSTNNDNGLNSNYSKRKCKNKFMV